MIIGITGGTGCGKTTALNVIRDLGGVVLDCDAIYHELLGSDRELLAAIEDRFPGTVRSGVPDRKKLGKLVFGDKQALMDLNCITHGRVAREVRRRLTPEPTLAAIDAIGLFESGIDKLCKLTVAVIAPEESRVARLMARDGISAEYAAARIAAQPSQAWFREKCDYCLENDGSEREFRAKCIAFFREMGIMDTV